MLIRHMQLNQVCADVFAIDIHTLFLRNIMCNCQSEVGSTNAKEKIEELLEASENGTITAAQVTEGTLDGLSLGQTHYESGEGVTVY